MIMKARARFKRLGLGPVVAAALAQWAATRWWCHTCPTC